jgi:hypothetical protein
VFAQPIKLDPPQRLADSGLAAQLSSAVFATFSFQAKKSSLVEVQEECGAFWVGAFRNHGRLPTNLSLHRLFSSSTRKCKGSEKNLCKFLITERVDTQKLQPSSHRIDIPSAEMS